MLLIKKEVKKQQKYWLFYPTVMGKLLRIGRETDHRSLHNSLGDGIISPSRPRLKKGVGIDKGIASVLLLREDCLCPFPI